MVLAIGAAPASAGCLGASAPPSAATIAQARQTTLCLLNERRAQLGLGPLGRDGMLDSAATGFSHRMVAERFFSHDSPDGGTLRDRLAAYVSGLSSWAIGENIAYGTGSYSTPGSIVEMWMNSSGHRANILSSRFRAVGIGIAPGNPRGAGGGATYTTDFGNVVRSGVGAGAQPPVVTTDEPGSKPKPRKTKKPKAKRKRARCARKRRVKRRAKCSRRVKRHARRRR